MNEAAAATAAKLTFWQMKSWICSFSSLIVNCSSTFRNSSFPQDTYMQLQFTFTGYTKF